MTGIEDELRRLREQKAEREEREREEIRLRHDAYVHEEAQRNEALNREARTILAPYVEAVRKSQIVEILRELVKAEKLGRNFGEKKPLAEPSVTFCVAMEQLLGPEKKGYYQIYSGFDLCYRLPEYAPKGEYQAFGVVTLHWNVGTSSTWMLDGTYPEASYDEIKFLFSRGDFSFNRKEGEFRMVASFKLAGSTENTGALVERDWDRSAVESLVARTYFAKTRE